MYRYLRKKELVLKTRKDKSNNKKTQYYLYKLTVLLQCGFYDYYFFCSSFLSLFV